MQISGRVKEVKNINKISLAKIIVLIYGLVGFFITLVVAALTIAIIITQKDFSGSIILIILFNVGAGLFLSVLSSILMALIGWVIGYITTGIYNWFAIKTGGIKIELADAAEIKKDNIREVANN